MCLSFFWSARISDVFVLLRPLLSFFRFQLAPAVEDAVCLLVVGSLDVISVLVVGVTLVLVAVVVVLFLAAVVVVVTVIFLAGDEVIFLHAPALTPTADLAVVALFLS